MSTITVDEMVKKIVEIASLCMENDIEYEMDIETFEVELSKYLYGLLKLRDVSYITKEW